MIRAIWEQVLDFASLPRYPKLPCPYCSNGTIALDQKSFTSKIVYKYREANANIPADEDKFDAARKTFEESKILGVLVGIATVLEESRWSRAKFCCFFKCESCGKDVSATGTARMMTLAIHPAAPPEEPRIKVEYFSPSVPLFQVSKNLPAAIKLDLLQSFSHFHSDTTASGAKLRKTIEKLCEDLKMEGNNLHRQLEHMKVQYPKEAALLHRLKLLGNEAVHANSVAKADLLDAFEVLEFVLGIYDRQLAQSKAEELSERIAKKYDRSGGNA